jgi:hypothetical protein
MPCSVLASPLIISLCCRVAKRMGVETQIEVMKGVQKPRAKQARLSIWVLY